MSTPLHSAVNSSAQARILVCDDASTQRALMAAVLGPRYSLLLTATGEEALARAPEYAPDLVITDHLLPGISGREVVSRLRAIPAFEDVPIILLTAVSDADARAEGIEAGADEYLVKPIRERELLARVASLLKLRRTLLALSRRSRELEEANEALREAQGRLVRSERLAALGTLAASLAHDINNPLAIISSGGAALRKIVDEAGRRPAPIDPQLHGGFLHELDAVAAEILGASRRMLELGRDLRLFGSGDPTAATRMRAEDAVRSAVSLACGRSASPPRVEVRVEGDPQLEAPGHLVTLVLLSIVDRAVCAAGPRGLVQIDVATSGGAAEIAVRDDGARIPDELLQRVFEPFVRLFPATETGGLGLAVAAGIAQGLGGHIDVDGCAPTGACFRVRLPLASA
jgi:C4-dicarboxylate-specific signal transduction histidine kinase